MIKNREFWQLSIPCECSWAWRTILKGRKEVVVLMRKIVGNGQSIKFWLEPWTARGTLSDYFPDLLQYHSICNRNATVSHLIEGETWCIPEFVRNQLCDTAREFKETEITDEEYEWVWTPTKSGSFALKGCMESCDQEEKRFHGIM